MATMFDPTPAQDLPPAPSHSLLDLPDDLDYLEKKYERVLGYHNDLFNTPEELLRFAHELDQINRKILEIKARRK